MMALPFFVAFASVWYGIFTLSVGWAVWSFVAECVCGLLWACFE